MPPPVLFYDGRCGLCAASVQFVLSRDEGGELRFAPLDSALAANVIARHPELGALDSVIWYEPGEEGTAGRVFAESDAAMQAGRYLGGRWKLAALLAGAVPRALRDGMYRFVARHRHRLSRGREKCLVPSPRDSHRFIEHD